MDNTKQTFCHTLIKICSWCFCYLLMYNILSPQLLCCATKVNVVLHRESARERERYQIMLSSLTLRLARLVTDSHQQDLLELAPGSKPATGMLGKLETKLGRDWCKDSLNTEEHLWLRPSSWTFFLSTLTSGQQLRMPCYGYKKNFLEVFCPRCCLLLLGYLPNLLLITV